MFSLVFFFFNDTATTEIYTLSLHDALPIFTHHHVHVVVPDHLGGIVGEDRKSTRLNSSHMSISYAVFCLKKKKNTPLTTPLDNQKDKPLMVNPHQFED